MAHNYIKFYSNYDLSTGAYLELAEPVINSFDPDKEYTDINEVIELFNIQRLMNSGVILKSWDLKTLEKLQNTCRLFTPVIGRFFSTIDSDNFIDYYKALYTDYTEEYWELFSHYKVFSRVDGHIIIELLENGYAALWPILQHKNVVSYYDSELGSFMRVSDQSALLLIDSFLSAGEREYCFPKSLLPTEYEAIFEAYIDSDCPNLSYLKLIADSQSTKDCPLSPKLRQKAKHRFESDFQQRAENAPTIQYGIDIGFDDIESYVSVDNTQPLHYHIVYDKKWIEDNLDYPTLLNNFRYIFEQVDFCWRSNLLSLPSQLGILERAIGVKGKREYKTGSQYHLAEMKALGEIRGYRNLLKKNGVELEDVFQWFFEDYLKAEFQANDFCFHATSSGASIVERIKNIASEMDGSLKQYRSFLDDGYIDRELYEMTSGQIVFSQLSSFFPDKYAYPNSSSIKKEMNLLFSDQSLIIYTQKYKSKYKSFGDLIVHENAQLKDFSSFQVESIKWLISRGVITESKESILQIKKARYEILRDLYIHGVICPHYYYTYSTTIHALKELGDLRYGSTLFSEPEQDYLNYILNQSEFSNGLDLRNKYLHGTYPRNSEAQEEDYDHLLLIMAFVIMKINEEFCLKKPYDAQEER